MICKVRIHKNGASRQVIIPSYIVKTLELQDDRYVNIEVINNDNG